MNEQHQCAVLVVFSGPSGSGKDTVLDRLLQMDDSLQLSISATTRAPRQGEQDERDYYFMTREGFENILARGEVLEHAEYCGNYYGTPSAPIAKWMDEGKSVILEIEVQGGAQVIEKRSDCVSVFLLPPSLAELERRLRKRGTESEEAIQKRIAAAQSEIEQAVRYDYAVINDDIDKAAAEILGIIRAEKHKTARNMAIIEGVLNNDKTI